MERHAISDHEWSIILPLLLLVGISNTKNLRRTFEGILFRSKTGIAWRDLPSRYGKCNTVYKRFREWSKTGKWENFFFLIVFCGQYVSGIVSIDGSTVKCHQHSSGARHGEETAIGRSAGGRTTKIHAACDDRARPLKIIITAGQVHDSQVAEQLMEGLTGVTHCIADRAYDSNAIRQVISKINGVPVIPRRKNSKNNDQPLDKEKYKIRHTIENLFARLKHFKAVATRYDKSKQSYEGVVMLAASMIWVRELAKFGELWY